MPELGASLSSTAATRGSVSLSASVNSAPGDGSGGGAGVGVAASPKKTFKLGERVVI
jgi:hypothetical protein